MERAVFVYTTWPTAVEAEAAGRQLVERRLAACVNILPHMTSICELAGRGRARRRGGHDHQDPGHARRRGVRRPVKGLHSYETPAILVMPLESVEKSYLGWLLAETGEPAKE